MSNDEFIRLAISLHCQTVIGLVDAVCRADTAAQRHERLALIRDASREFKRDMLAILVEGRA